MKQKMILLAESKGYFFFYSNTPSPLIVFTQMTMRSATRLADTLTIYLSKLMNYF